MPQQWEGAQLDITRQLQGAEADVDHKHVREDRIMICKELVAHLPDHSSSKILQVTTFTWLAVQ